MQSNNRYGCETSCRYFYADWQKSRFYCCKHGKQLNTPVVDCPDWDDKICDDIWLQFLESRALEQMQNSRE